MKALRNILLYLILFVVVLFTLLYVAVNSSYVFDRVTRYFAPQYGVHYDKVSGNAWTGITIEGVYYKEKKLARKIAIRLNPATLLEKKITLSHLRLHGVNEQYLEAMIADLSNDTGESDGSFPFSVHLNDVRLSMLPFSISGIHFSQADLRVASIEYAEDAFSFGTLRLIAQTSLGHTDIEGHYQGGELQLSKLNIENLNTEEIERNLLDQKESRSGEENKTAEGSSSIFIPKILFAKRLKVTVLPRKYRDISLSLLSMDGTDIRVDLEHETVAGALMLYLRTDVVKADIDILASVDKLEFRKITLDDINLTKILAISSSENEDNKSKPMTEGGRGHSTTIGDHLPFVPDQLSIGSLSAVFLPLKQNDISISKARLRVEKLQFDLSRMLAKEGDVWLDVESQIISLHHQGKIKNNQLSSHIEAKPKEALFGRYHLPLRREAFSVLSLDVVTDKNGVSASMPFAAPRILDAKKDAFNVDINASLLHLNYLFSTGELTADMRSDIDTPYAKNILFCLNVAQKNRLKIQGKTYVESIDSIDPKLGSLLKGLTVHFDGDLHGMNATIESKKIQGEAVLNGLSTGTVHIETKEALVVGKLLKLPGAFENTKAKILIDMPIDTKSILPLHAKVKVLSNVLNMDAGVSYNKEISLKAVATIPPKSLLKNLDKNIQFSALSPMQLDMTLNSDDLQVKLGAKKLALTANHHLKSGLTRGDINLAGSHLKISATSAETLSLTLGSGSVQTLLGAVNSIYRVSLPDISGDIALRAEIKKLASLAVTLKSKELKLGKSKKATPVSNLSLKAKGDINGMTIERYALEIQGTKFYATKPSKILLQGDVLHLSPFWLNDMLKSAGTYNIKQKKGEVTTQATALKIKHEWADVITALGVDTQINGDKISFRGKVHLNGGNINYDLNTKSFAADSDIIILQKQRKKNNYFKKNIAIQLAVDSAKPLRYKKDKINIALLPELKINKRFGGGMRVHGKIILLSGGSYRFEGKKFVLKKSSIVFKGKPTAPILNINIAYQHAGTTIRIKVSGTASDPSLDFSSDPAMSREEILSYIMFDTDSAARENKASDVSNLLAGSLVKSLFASMGLKLDHLVLTGTGFEVGKKLSDRITVIYDQQKEPTVKLRIQNTKHIETDISFGASSRSADIFYKKEF